MAKNEIRLVKLEAQGSQILSHLAAMDVKMDGLDSLIRGNGRPGLATVQAEHAVRLKNLETGKKNWKELTILVVSGGVIALFTAAMQHFVR
jgi:hypothetical protein